MGIGDAEQKLLDEIIVRHPRIEKGKHWFRGGEPFEAVYAVRSGSIKTYHTLPDGTEQITGVYFPGELIGLDAIHSRRHACSAMALESASVCAIPFCELDRLSVRIPELNRQLVRIMSREISRDRALISLLGNKTAEERIAWLLFRIVHGLEQRRCAAREFVLSMSRNDIGNYLGLAVETVSRIFTRFRTRGLLSVHGRHIRVRDFDRLRRLAEAHSA
jgi:CRP/FNR family transcriptional regulator